MPPSLYTVNVYSISWFVSAVKAFFGWLYVAVSAVPFSKLVASTTGNLEISGATPPIFVIDFLSAKSKYLGAGKSTSILSA